MRKKTKSDRTQQVQFRMPEKLHNELRKKLIDDKISMADLFNKAAIKYLNDSSNKSTTQTKNQ